MRLEEIGSQIRQARQSRHWTQAQLAAAAHVTRTTLNQLENGVVGDLGIRKIQTLLDQLGLAIAVVPKPEHAPPSFLTMAATTASISTKTRLTEQELLKALLSGKVPPGRRVHLRTLLSESRPKILEGLVEQVTQWAPKAKIQRNLARLAAELGVTERAS
jgi:transcriptional regulator with XRE-family HTH domain